MPKLQANFEEISTSYEAPPEGEYRVNVEEIDEIESQENKIPGLNFKLVVTEGDFEKRVIYDRVFLQTKEGKANTIGLGRVKAYAEAILGEEAANGSEIDTDDLKGGTCIVLLKTRSYKDKDSGEQKTSADVKKVLPAG